MANITSKGLVALVLGLIATVLMATSSDRAQAAIPPLELVPGSYIAKTHETTPLIHAPFTSDSAVFLRWADLSSLAAADPIALAGAHPDGTTSFELEAGGGLVRDVIVDLPVGFLGNPEAVPACPREAFQRFSVEPGADTCPPSTQVGVATVHLGGTVSGAPQTFPVYRLTRPEGAPAAFGFVFASQVIVLNARVRSDGDYGVSVVSRNTAASPAFVLAATVTLWGVPADSVHDIDRWEPASASWGATSTIEPRPFLITPPRCNTGPLDTVISMRSWQEPNRWLPRDASNPEDYVASSPEGTNCEGLPAFSPELDMRPLVRKSGSPSGYDAKLTMPYNDDPNGRSFAHLKKVEVTLPEGVSVSPSAAHGLVGCTDSQAGFGTESEAACPDASKIGQVSVETPLLPESLNGAVYIGTPTAEQLLRLFIILKGFGVTVRVAGDVETDPVTGQIRAIFDNNPQLPFTAMNLKFDPGARASLVNPDTCGKHEVVTTFTSWNGDRTESKSDFHVSADGAGAACAHPRPFAPWLDANTTNGLSGEYSQFFTRFGRSDADEQIDSIAVELPMGLAAKIAGVPRCPADRADAGTCGPESRVGHVQAAAGAGPQPFWVPGPGKDATSVSLAGPYRGSPFSLSIVVPAQAGPFDLGRVVVRAPISVDMRTAQVSVDVGESRWYDRFGRLAQTLQGKMPTILEGIPLRLKETRVIMDRDDFMVNPTGCDVKQVKARIGAVDGRVADVSSPFRATDCADLGFNPRFNMRILDKGRRSTKRSWNPRTRFVLRPRPGDANMGPTVVTLPSSVILDQSNIKTLCTRAQFAERKCPDRAIYGYAKAWSPLLDEPVEGPVYMQANGGARPLPDILADLDGQVRVALEGWIDTVRSGRKGRLRNRFMVVPDVPVTRFELTMRGGGDRGLLVNSTDLCRSRERGVARFRGANGKLSVQRPAIQTTFKGCKKVRRAAARKAAKRKADRAAATRAWRHGFPR